MRDLRNGHFILFDDYDENYKKEERERERVEEVKKCQIEINSTKKNFEWYSPSSKLSGWI